MTNNMKLSKFSKTRSGNSLLDFQKYKAQKKIYQIFFMLRNVNKVNSME